MELSAFVLLLLAFSRPCSAASPPAPYGPVPSADQLAWSEVEYYCIIHLSLNTYTGQEWGFGNESVALFNPTNFDANAIAAVVKAAGMKGMNVVAKHHCGFCLWPSAYTDSLTTWYSVANTNCPWKAGKGDMLRDYANACQAYGLKLGVYLSPWDRHSADYGLSNNIYPAYYQSQLQELTLNYGPLFIVWFDGANGGNGWYGGCNCTRTITASTYYGWPSIYGIVDTNQPLAGMFNNDIRWVGNENGVANSPCWATMGAGGSGNAASGVRPGAIWQPAECDVPLRSNYWFYASAGDNQVRSPAALYDLYFQSVGNGAALDIGLAPTGAGTLFSNDVEALTQFGRMLKCTFGSNLARNAHVISGSSRGGDPAYAAANMLDTNRATYWSTDDSITNPAVVLGFDQPVTFSVVGLKEYLPLGQREDSWAVDALLNGQWQQVAGAAGIGAQRYVRISPVSTTQVRLRVQGPVCPAISEFGLYSEALNWTGAGNDGNWGSSNNWSGLTPVDGDSLVFAGTARQNCTNNLSGLALGQISFNNDGFDLYGNGVTLSNGLNNVTGNSLLNLDVALAADSVTFDGAGNTTVSGVISGSGGLTKLGGGILTLSGTNSYTGATTISAGTLALSDGGSLVGTPAITLSPGAILDVANASGFSLAPGVSLTAGRSSGFDTDINGDLASAGSLNIGSSAAPATLTINGGLALTGGAIIFHLSNTNYIGGGVNDLITCTGPLRLSGSTIIQGSFINGGLAPGTYVLIRGASLASGGAANLALGSGFPVTGSQTCVLDVTSQPGSVLLQVTGSSGPATQLIWDPNSLAGAQDGSGTWDRSSANWWNGTQDVVWVDNSLATLGVNTPSNCVVTIAADVAPGGLAFNATGGGVYTLAGSASIVLSNSVTITTSASATNRVALRGPGALLKAGAGTLVLSSNNYYAGGTTITAGTLILAAASGQTIHGNLAIGSGGIARLGTANALASNSVVSVGVGGTLALNGKNCAVGYLAGGGTLSNLSNLYLDLGAVDQTFSGSFASATNLFVRGANAGGGTQIFNGSASLNQLIVGYQTGNMNGNLKLSSGSLTVSGNTYVGGGPTLSASENVTGTLTVSGGTLTLNGSEFDLGQSVNGTTPVALFTQTGGAVLDNAGWTGIANGGGISQMDLSGGTFTMSPGAQYPGLKLGIRGNATLNLSGSAQLITPSLFLMHSAAGSGKFATVNLNGGILTVGYVATGNPGSLSTFNFNGGTLRASLSTNAFLQGLTGAYVQDGGAVIDSSGYNITFNQGLLDSGNGGLTKLGAGTLVLNATNTYSGPTVVAAGTLALGASGAFAMSSLLDVQTNTILDASLLTNALVVPASQTLRGDGSVLGRIVVNGVLAPGETGLGNLSFNTNVDLAGLTIVKIAKGGTSMSNDMVLAGGNLLQGGTLLVTNLGPALVAGDSFTLISATTRSGAFTNLALPLVGPGLYWDTATLNTNGTLRVAAIPRPQITASLIPGNMLIQVASIAGRTYVLERTTNLVAPIVWAAQTSNSGNGDVLTFAAPIMGTSAIAFYRLRIN